MTNRRSFFARALALLGVGKVVEAEVVPCQPPFEVVTPSLRQRLMASILAMDHPADSFGIRASFPSELAGKLMDEVFPRQEGFGLSDGIIGQDAEGGTWHMHCDTRPARFLNREDAEGSDYSKAVPYFAEENGKVSVSPEYLSAPWTQVVVWRYSKSRKCPSGFADCDDHHGASGCIGPVGTEGISGPVGMPGPRGPDEFGREETDEENRQRWVEALEHNRRFYAGMGGKV